MSSDKKNNDYLFSGGLAEFVPNPSPLTYSFFSHWFTGAQSLGRAMKILGLPYEKISLPILALEKNEVLVNLLHEEKTLYKKTIFSYKIQKNFHDIPQLTPSLTKIMNPTNWLATMVITKKQSEWIAFPQKTVNAAKNLIPTHQKELEDIAAIDHYLSQDIWPTVIAIGTLAEFYYQLIMKEFQGKSQWHDIQAYISTQVAKDDWFFHAYTDQVMVKEGQMTFDAYIQEYGIRSDNDYELITPRWSEIPDQLKIHINESVKSPKKDEKPLPAAITTQQEAWIQASISLMILRSQAKKIALRYMFQLRQAIIAAAKTSEISGLQRELLLHGDFSIKTPLPKVSEKSPHQTFTLEGKGIAVSAGKVQGSIIFVNEATKSIPAGSIAIFSNASPLFAPFYPTCQGMIFLKGGQTSHGAIVAREFGIPAIIDPQAAHAPEGKLCELNATDGSWKITK